jgi:predicted ATPase/DNA-binding winged helix-turn-helix (wHTH) protein
MSQQRSHPVYESGQWQVHLGRRELLACGVPVPIGPRAFEVMEVLVRSANELVTKDALMDRVWPGAMVGENTLHVHISAIRKALGRDRAMLKTASGRGYRLLGDWVARRDGTAGEPVDRLEPVRMPTRTFRTNLPETAPGLIGRTIAVPQIQDILSANRAITLTGPGGIGKTALALHVSNRMRLTFGGDIWFIELASLSDPNLLPAALAGALGLDLNGDEITAEAVARAIGDQPVLLVVDNCEHVIDAAARLVETILCLCARASVLATSQEPLRIAGEHVYRVLPLEVPRHDWGEPDHVLEQSAVQLFVARLQALDLTFAASRENIHSIAAICHHLDGIPLAIEFAAARASTLGVQYVASHLENRFGLLTSGRRAAHPKHRTLRAAVDWSYELLSDTEQSLLGHLAIFDAGFTLEVVTTVMSSAGYPEATVLEGIANLVVKSFVTLSRSPSGDRWALPETIRAYALEKLVASGKVEATARSRAMFDSGLCESTSQARSQPLIAEIVGEALEDDNPRPEITWAFPRSDGAPSAPCAIPSDGSAELHPHGLQ